MIRSEYDRELSQVQMADDFGQVVLLSSGQAFMLLRALSHLFSQCQGCDQVVSPDGVQVLTCMREVAPFRVQTAWLCPDCYADMLSLSLRTAIQELGGILYETVGRC